MSNIVNYIKHKLYTNQFYHRQANNDLEDESSAVSRASRIGFQFIFLYKPAANLCNIGLSTIRSFSNFSKLIKRIEEQNFDEKTFSDAYATSLSIITLAGAYFNFTVGLLLTTLSDISTNITQIYHAIKENNSEKAFEITMQAIGSTLYLGIMISGSLEAVLASLILQTLISLLQASKDLKKGRYLEAAANIILSAIRANEANGQLRLIKKRNTFLQIKKFKDISNRIKKSRDINDLYDHPFIKLAEKVNEKSVILKDANDKEIDFGAHFFGFGKKHVKGMNLSLKKEKNYIELEFKVNHVFRDKLAKLTDELKSFDPKDLNDFLKICGSHSSGVSFDEKKSLNINSYYSPKDTVINIEGIGSLSIGSSKDMVGLYDRIQVRLKKDKNLYDIHKILSFFDLTDVLKVSASEDIERLKIGQVFRLCCPKDASKFERTKEFFTLPIEHLKQKIIQMAPVMEDHFLNYLPRLELREILPGKMRYAIKELSDDLYKLGARNLTAMITGAYNDDELCKRVVSMFRMGALSSQTRNYANMHSNGLGSLGDFYSGGSDSVFTQIVTENNKSYSEMWYSGKVRLLYSLKALETISYQYQYDSFGSRQFNDSWIWWEGDYLNRPNIFNFIKNQMQYYTGGNDVMIKERIPPEHIEGIVVQSDTLKTKIITALENAGLLIVDELGNKSIFGKAIDAFIQVGNAIVKK